MGKKDWYRVDPGIVEGRMSPAEVRDIIDGKFEMIPKTKEHIKVDQDRCIGDACAICASCCPSGSFEMVDGKAYWKYGMTHCLECGICQYVCSVAAIDWSYPEAGTGVILKWS
ncbi:MAG: hypothetical protein FWD27_05485 [Coriobacteriia bacterium]|nr:hypothetical protein [Coriobacteriia bacterium]